VLQQKGVVSKPRSLNAVAGVGVIVRCGRLAGHLELKTLHGDGGSGRCGGENAGREAGKKAIAQAKIRRGRQPLLRAFRRHWTYLLYA
jgi:hypothetical protein